MYDSLEKVEKVKTVTYDATTIYFVLIILKLLYSLLVCIDYLLKIN